MGPKRRMLSVEEKLKLLSDIERSPDVKKSHWAQVYKLSSSTLSTIISKREAIKESAKKLKGNLYNRTRWRPSPFVDVEMVLLEWLQQCSALNIPMDRYSIREKGLLVARKFNYPNFTASDGWIVRFKQRHGLTCASKKNNSPYSDPPISASKWISEKLKELLKDYEARDIYNADETGLFYNLLMEKSCFDMEDYQDSDDRGDRLTVLLCVNSDSSDKLPPLIVGKAKSPCGLKNFQTLRCKYVSNQKAWITTTVFQEYLNFIDSEMETAGRKILLFIDHCAAHPPDIYLKNIKVIFFPASCADKVQPLSIGVKNSFKEGYRKTFDQKLVKKRDDPQSQNVNLIEALQCVVLSWDEVSPAVIRNCFFRAGLHVPNNDEEVYSVSDASDSSKTIDPNNTIPTCGELTIDEICDQFLLNQKFLGEEKNVVTHESAPVDDSNLETENLSDEFDEISENNGSGSDVSPYENSQEAVSDEEHVSEPEIGDQESDDDETDNRTPDFEEALSGFKKYKKYICSFNIDEDMKNTLLIMEIALYKLHNREIAHQSLVGI